MMLQIDLHMSDCELSLVIAAHCALAGTVRSVKIHRQPKPFALVDMATQDETLALAAQNGRPAFGNSVLFPLEPAHRSN
jgi:hypothetical protein